MKLFNDDLCRLCGKEDKTAEHFLCSCDAFVITRLRHLSCAYPRAEKYQKLKLENIWKVKKKINSRLDGIANR